MSGLALNYRALTATANGQETASVTGRWITFTAATGSFEVQINGGSFFKAFAGLQIPWGTVIENVTVKDTSGSGNTIEFYVTEQQIRDGRNVVGGSLNVDIVGASISGGVPVDPIAPTMGESYFYSDPAASGQFTIVTAAANTNGVLLTNAIVGATDFPSSGVGDVLAYFYAYSAPYHWRIVQLSVMHSSDHGNLQEHLPYPIIIPAGYDFKALDDAEIVLSANYTIL